MGKRQVIKLGIYLVILALGGVLWYIKAISPSYFMDTTAVYKGF